MQTVSGQIVKFLQGPGGKVHGLILDGGQEIRFPADEGHLLMLIVTVGSHVGIEGIRRSGPSSEEYWDASLITNFDSKRSLTFLAPKCQVQPGMPLPNTPSATASLAHPATSADVPAAAGKTPEESLPDVRDLYRKGVSSLYRAQPSSAPDVLAIHLSRPPKLMRAESAANIGHAYDCLHRVQAILAYLHIMRRQVHGVGQFLDEAKHTYEQALGRYESRNFLAASEFAAASASLSRVVEIIMSRTLRSDTSIPSLVPPPPEHYFHFTDASHVEEDLAEAGSILSRIHWLLENGTLPLEDRTQVRRISSWGDALYKQAQHMFRQTSLPDAAELAQAALAGAYSAEHVCRMWYVGQVAQSPDKVTGTLHTH